MAKHFLRWAGSKAKLIPQIKALIEGEYERYIEPFVGSGRLFFNLEPENAIISDVNEDLIETYQEIADNYRVVEGLLATYPVEKEFYYKLRATSPKKLTTTEIAARFIYLNRYCFNGLYRTNLKGEFNVPFAPLRTGNLPNLTEWEAISEQLQKTTICCADFQETIEKAGKNDLIYLDPPYLSSEKRIFSEYNPKCFSRNDLDRLEDQILQVDGSGAKFILSYLDEPLVVKKFEHWRQINVTAQRNIAGFTNKRKLAKELLITNIDESCS